MPKKHSISILLGALSLLFLMSLNSFSCAGKEKIIFFWGQGCLHCAKVEKFIQKNKLDNYFEIEKKEIYFNQENRKEFIKECQNFNIPLESQGVPMAIINDKCLIGDEPIINALKAKMAVINPDAGTSTEENPSSDSKKERTSSAKKLTLPLVLGAALVDAINPCAFAVLIILMTTVLAAGSRRRALFAGIAFASAIYISYLSMGLGVYKALSTVNLSNWFMKFIAGLAILVGLLNIKDYFWYGGGGFLMEVPLSWRPKMKSLIHSVTSPLGAFFIGILISLFLLPCTSGPYIVILGMLSQKETFLTALSWLLLYNAVFVLPMIIITLSCYFGLKPERVEKLRQKKIRLLHLLAGAIMIILGIAIFLNFIQFS